MAALDPIREEIFRQARSESRHEPPDAYAADALAEMARRSGDGETGAWTTAERTHTAPEADGPTSTAAAAATHMARSTGSGGSAGSAGSGWVRWVRRVRRVGRVRRVRGGRRTCED